MTRSVCFAFLPTYDDPMFNWRFFYYCFIVNEIHLAEWDREDPFY